MNKVPLQQLSLVWAKVKGYPWWPATINKEYLEVQSRSEKIVVNFLGENSHAEININMMKEFRTHFDEYSKMKNKKLLQSIKLALDLEQQLIVFNTLPLEQTTTNPPDKKESCKGSTEQTKTNEEDLLNIIDNNNIQHLEEKPVDQLKPDPVQKIEPTNENKPQRVHINRKYALSKRIKKSECNPVKRIPFRKFQEISFEGKIVELINNLNSKKNCVNELLRILKKTRKIKNKEIFNRYIISGLMVAYKLVLRNEKEVKVYPPEAIEELRQAIVELEQKIVDLLRIASKIDQQILIQQNQVSEKEDMKINVQNVLIQDKKGEIIRTCHRIIKGKHKNLPQCKYLALKIYADWDENTENKSFGAVSKLFISLANQSSDYFEHLAQTIETD